MRDDRFDIIKGVAIVLMVVGHAGCARPLHDFIYLFHMPAFFILAGWFSRSATGWDDVCTFFRKKAVRLWWPFAFWSALFVLLHNLLLRFGVYPDLAQSSAEGFARILYEPWGADKIARSVLACILLQGGNYLMMAQLWFLQVLFFATSIYFLSGVLLARLRIGEVGQKILLLAGAMAVLVATRNQLCGKLIILESHLGGPVIATACVLVAVGSCLKGCDRVLDRLRPWMRASLAAACLAVLVLMSRMGTLELCSNDYPSIPFMLAASVTGWMLLLLVAGFGFPGRGLLAYMGRHTLPILILHVLVFRMVNFIVVAFAGEPLWHMGLRLVVREGPLWCLLYTVVGVAVPLALYAVYKSAWDVVGNWKERKCASVS